MQNLRFWISCKVQAIMMIFPIHILRHQITPGQNDIYFLINFHCRHQILGADQHTLRPTNIRYQANLTWVP